MNAKLTPLFFFLAITESVRDAGQPTETFADSVLINARNIKSFEVLE